MILKPNYLEPEIGKNVILKFTLFISLVCYKDTDIEALVLAFVSHHCLVLSCLMIKFAICSARRQLLTERIRAASEK